MSFMLRAIELAKRASLEVRSGGCFGAVITCKTADGVECCVAEGYNEVLTKKDPTCHAEMQAIRSACEKLGTHILSDVTLYTTGEPCPMCLCAAAWARIPKIIYASTVQDAKTYGNFDDEQFYSDVIMGKVTHLEKDEAARAIMIELWEKYRDSKPVHY